MSYSTEVLADSPVAYLRLDDAAATAAADASGNALNGSYNGGVTQQVAGLLVNDANKAALFDGGSGYVDLGNPVALQILDQVTMECWVNVGEFPQNDGDTAVFIAKGYEAEVGEGYFLRLFNGG